MRARWLALLVTCAACASVEVPQPESPDTAVIGARGWLNLPARSGHQDSSGGADGFYFVKFSEDGDPTRVGEVIESNHAEGATHYLFNAAPGRYAVIGCYHKRDGRKANVYFSAKTIRASVFTVGRAKLAFAGNYRVRASYEVSQADEAQKHYFKTLDPKLYRAGVLDRMISPTDALLEKSLTLQRDDKAAEAFHARARSHLKETGWPSHFRPSRLSDKPSD